MLLDDGGPNCIRFGENGDQLSLHQTSYFGLDILPRFEVMTTHRQVLSKMELKLHTFRPSPPPPVKLWEEGSIANDCSSLLQPVDDTLSIALTNVSGATRTLSYLRVLL